MNAARPVNQMARNASRISIVKAETIVLTMTAHATIAHVMIEAARAHRDPVASIVTVAPAAVVVAEAAARDAKQQNTKARLKG